tara:strand:+ start:60 stop:203 length:144 start_codon:yes stop_codon:yes gene_type:complete
LGGRIVHIGIYGTQKLQEGVQELPQETQAKEAARTAERSPEQDDQGG